LSIIQPCLGFERGQLFGNTFDSLFPWIGWIDSEDLCS